MTIRRIRFAAAAAIAVAVLIITGCSTDSDDSSSASSPATTTSSEAPAGPSESEQLSSVFAVNYDSTSWYPLVTGVRVDKNNAYVTAQVDRNSDKQIAETIQRAMVNLIETGDNDDQFGNVRWVIVEDSSGTVVTQQQVKR